MIQEHAVAQLDSALLPDLAQHLRSLVASGELDPVEAEAILLAALEAAAQDEPGTVTSRRIEQIESLATKAIIATGIKKLNDILIGRVDKAAAKLDKIKPEKAKNPVAKMYDIYQWGASEQGAIEAQVRVMRYDAYQAKLAELAETVGCPSAAGRAQKPSGPSRAELDRQSKTDAQSIVTTWNREARAQIERLATANPDADSTFYRREMEAWYKARDKWKQAQIGLMSTQMARNLAREDFYGRNGTLLVKPQFRFVGPPPREIECADLMAQGVVGEDVVKANPTPIHIGCPHEWQAVKGQRRVDCNRLWVG